MADGGDDQPQFISEFESEIDDMYRKKGKTGVLSYIKDHMPLWSAIPLNVGVIGKSKVGKSTFINTIRGLQCDDDGAAETDVIQCTIEPTSYQDPGNSNLVYWDLPGVGTPTYPKETYLKRIEFERYDFFLLLSNSTFEEDDLWLAKSMKKQGRMFFFIRTHVDIDVHKANRNRKQKESELCVHYRVKKNILEGLESGGMSDTDVFLIDCGEQHKYDFNVLIETLIDKSPDIKKDAMVLSLSFLTRNVIYKKKEAIRKRIKYVAVASATAGAVPIPGIGTVADTAMVLREALEYRKQFSLDEEGLGRFARWLKIPVKDLLASLELKSTGISFTTKGIVMLIRETFVKKITEDSAKYVIPVVGSIISAGASYLSTKKFLESLLDVLYKDAIRLNEYMMTVAATSAQV